jgi:hypothetical protein
VRVRAWGPSNRVPPCVPEYVEAFEGNFGRKGPYLNDMFTRPCPQVEVAEGWWLGVRHDGVVEAFKESDEQDWRAKAAMAAVQAQANPGDNPDRAVAVLRSAADLVGLDLPDLMEKLEQAKKGGESLMDVFRRTWKKPDGP